MQGMLALVLGCPGQGPIPGVPQTGVWVFAGWTNFHPDPNPSVPYPVPHGVYPTPANP